MALGLGHQRLAAKRSFAVAAPSVISQGIAKSQVAWGLLGGIYPMPILDAVASTPRLRFKGCKVSLFKTEAPLAVKDSGPEGVLAHRPGFVRYRFVVPQYITTFGQSLRVVGSLPELGTWDPHQAPAMEWSEGHQWSLECALPQQSFEFKIIVSDGHGIKWEGGSNRVVQAEGEDADVPVEIVVWLTCNFDATANTQMQLAVPRSSIEDAYETGKATLEFLRLRRSKLGHDSEQASGEVDRRQQAAELARLAEAVAEQSSVVHQLGDLLGQDAAVGRGAGQHGSALSGQAVEDEDQVLLLAIDSVQVPRMLRRISFVQAWRPGPAALASGDGSAPAPDAASALASPFLRGELDSRAEDLMDAAEELLQVQASFEEPPQDGTSLTLGWASLAQEAENVAQALAALDAGTEACRATQLQMQGLASVGSTLAGANPTITSSNDIAGDVGAFVDAHMEAAEAEDEVGSARLSTPAMIVAAGAVAGGVEAGGATVALEAEGSRIWAPGVEARAGTAVGSGPGLPAIDNFAAGAADVFLVPGGGLAASPSTDGSGPMAGNLGDGNISSNHLSGSHGPLSHAASPSKGDERTVPEAHPLQHLAAAVKEALWAAPTLAREPRAAPQSDGVASPRSPGPVDRTEVLVYAPASDGAPHDPTRNDGGGRQGQLTRKGNDPRTPWSRIRHFLDSLFL